MNPEEEILKVKDPNKQTISRLKSLLSAAGQGSRLPTTEAKKDVYVRTFVEFQQQLKNEQLNGTKIKRKRESLAKPIEKVLSSEEEDSPVKKNRKDDDDTSPPKSNKRKSTVLEEDEKETKEEDHKTKKLKKTPKDKKRHSNAFQMAHDSEEGEDEIKINEGRKSIAAIKYKEKSKTKRSKTPPSESEDNDQPPSDWISSDQPLTPPADKHREEEIKSIPKHSSIDTPTPRNVKSTQDRKHDIPIRQDTPLSNRLSAPGLPINQPDTPIMRPIPKEIPNFPNRPLKQDTPFPNRQSLTMQDALGSRHSQDALGSRHSSHSRESAKRIDSNLVQRQSTTSGHSNSKNTSVHLSRPTNPTNEVSWKKSLGLFVLIAFWIVIFAIGAQLVMNRRRFCVEADEANCIPCPANANCDDGRLKCDSGYVPSSEGDQCIEDEAFEQQIHTMVEKARRLLSQLNGKYLCHEVDSKSLTEAQLREKLGEHTDTVLERLRNNSEFHVGMVEDEYFSTEYILPFWCSIKWKASELKFHIGTVVIAIIGILWWLRKQRLEQHERQVATLLASDSLKLLQKHKYQSQQLSLSEAHIAVDHLRDTLLKPPIDKKKRDKLWKMAKEIIHMDTRVIERPILYHGEQKTTWEWTGPILLSDQELAGSPTRFSGPAIDEGSTPAVEKRYSDIFLPRNFQS